jgi:hypothetical protein
VVAESLLQVPPDSPLLRQAEAGKIYKVITSGSSHNITVSKNSEYGIKLKVLLMRIRQLF